MIKYPALLIAVIFISCKQEKKRPAGTHPPAKELQTAFNCTDLKEGTFRMAFYAVPDDTAVVTRKNNLQTEYYRASKFEVTTRMNWTDSCAYEITMVETNDPPSNKDKGKKALVRITKRQNDTIYFVSKFDDPNLPEHKGWMVKTGE
ncbi:MAG TPA: hypothetical protein VEC12_10920 [Bacteroidia bacterium]|nr:hypothetical protein [Bacteroidia bacterium]